MIAVFFHPFFRAGDWRGRYLAAQYNEDSLRYSLLAISLFFGLWSSLHYFLAGKTIRREFSKS